MSTTTQSATVLSHAHETLDALAWRQLGETAGHVEATLAANPGLAKLATDLPEGHAVRIVKVPQPTAQLVHLWD